MRTTVEIPADLLRSAKARAADRGESLKEFFTRAVAHEIGTHPGSAKAGRVRLPLVKGNAGPQIMVTNDDIASALAAEDAERYGGQ